MQEIARRAGNRKFCGASALRFLAAASAMLALLVLLSPGRLRAQLATADVLGTVTDSTGAVISDAKVTLLSTGTGITVTQTSNKVGEFIFSHVQIGTFNVAIEANGFKRFTVTGLTVNQGDRIRVNAKLEVGSQVETVEVEASAAAQLQTDTSDIGSLISTNAVADMPLNGRNYYDLITLQAGTTTESSGGFSLDPRPTMAFSANGQDAMYNNNMIDGMDNNERSMGTVAIEPSLDALQEVKVETNMYSAEYSHTGGGIANLITKSGTNKLSGTLFEFMRNDDFDAYPWAAAGESKTKTELRQNQFGGSLGGPILKNKAFFFGDYSGWRQVKGAVSKDMVENLAEYNAIQAYSASGSITLSDQWDAWEGAQPLSITSGQVNPLGLAYARSFPKPVCDPSCDAADSYNWYGATNQVQNTDTYDARIDYHLNDKNTLFGRYSYNKATSQSPGLPATKIVSGDSHTYSSGATVTPLIAQNLALDYVHIFSPATLFEAKSSYLRTNEATEPANSYWTMDKVGIPCSSDYCYNVDGVMGLPNAMFQTSHSPNAPYQTALAPYPTVGDNGGHAYVENTFQYNGALTLNRKTHSIKVGAILIRRQAETPTSGNNFAYFSPNYTGNALADMLEGLSVGLSEDVVMIQQRFRMWEPSAYFQDDWRVTNSLTLNLGVRYDIYTPWTERYGHMSNFDLNSDLIVSPTLLGANEAGPTGNIKTDHGDIAPRIGFAYSLPRSTVIRGGWGLSYFPGNVSGTGSFQLLNAPFIWDMGCGVSGYASPTCSSYSANIASDGGFNLEYGMPRPTYDITLATSTANYAQSLGIQSIFILPNYKPSYLEQMNLQVQKQIGKDIFTAGFVSSLGRRLPTRQDLNQPPVATASLGNVNGPTHYPMYSASTSWMDGVYMYEEMSEVTSSWLAGEATYERQLSHGLSTSVNFTWARSEGDDTGLSACVLNGCPMDNGSGGTTSVKGWQQYQWSGSTSHRAAGMVTYKIPYGQSLHGVAGAVAKGWELNATGYWQTGAWNTVYDTTNRSGMSQFANHQSTERPNQIASVHTSNRSLSHWFNTSAFALQTAYTLGNAGENEIEGPRSRDLDLGLGKTFSLLEGFKLQFRAETFNLTNTPNYSGSSGPWGGTYTIAGFDSNGVATSASGFGNINSVSNDSREFQFGLKLIY
jgi:hypothetical protein